MKPIDVACPACEAPVGVRCGEKVLMSRPGGKVVAVGTCGARLAAWRAAPVSVDLEKLREQATDFEPHGAEHWSVLELIAEVERLEEARDCHEAARKDVVAQNEKLRATIEQLDGVDRWTADLLAALEKHLPSSTPRTVNSIDRAVGRLVSEIGRLSVDLQLRAEALTLITEDRDKFARQSAELAAAGAQLMRDVQEWKRRAAAHGCDVEKGDPDCA